MRSEHPTIGVIDDDKGVLDSLEGFFESAGFSTRVYRSGDLFLGSGGIQTVDCVISDIGMAGASGLEVLEAVQRERPELPVFLITGRHEPGLSELAIRDGARQFFQKPVDCNKLLAAVEAALQREPK